MQCIENKSYINNSSAETWAQQKSADFIFQATLWRAFPVIIVTYLFGLYASQVNRQLVLILSIFGNCIHVLICQAIIYKHLTEYWWYISAFIAGMAGGTNILGIVINLVITECTEESKRSSRFVRINAVTTALSAAATFGIGYYIQWRGYTDLLWMAVVVELISILVVIIFLKPTRHLEPIDETTTLITSSSSSPNDTQIMINKSFISKFYHCFDICTAFNFQNRSKKKTVGLILIVVSYMFHLLASSSLSPMLWYLLGTPFCWTSKDLGQFSALALITTAIFSVLGMKLLSYIGTSDAIICSLSQICFFIYALWISLAQYSWQLYLALLINPFTGYQNLLTIPMISKWLEVHERNHVFTLVTEINTIILAFGSSFFNWVYARTVIYQKNFTLLLASALCILPIILNLCIFVIGRQVSNEQQDTLVSEINTDSATLPLLNNPLSQIGDAPCVTQLPHSRTGSFYTSHNDISLSDSYGSITNQYNRQRIA